MSISIFSLLGLMALAVAAGLKTPRRQGLAGAHVFTGQQVAAH